MGDTDTHIAMTTVFTESSFCTELYAQFAEQTHTSVPTVSRSWASDDNNHGACHPYDAGYGPFSPGWYCPAGWSTAMTSTNEASSYLDVSCCPSGYSYDRKCIKTTTDVRVYSTDAMLSPYFLTFPTAVVEAEYFWLQQPLGTVPPPTPAPTGPTDSDSDSGDRPDSTSTSNSGSEAGGLSKGAQAGIGVGVAAAVLIMVLAGFYLWMRRRKVGAKNKGGESRVEVTYLGGMNGGSAGQGPINNALVNQAPDLEDTGDKAGNTISTTTAVPDSHTELPATEHNPPRGEELDAQSQPQNPELDSTTRKELGGTQSNELGGTQRRELDSTQRNELDSTQRLELESQERRQRHELETGMSATVRDVPELMYSTEFYELEGPKNEPRPELDSNEKAGTDAGVVAPGGERELSELEQIEAEEERLKKRREELLAAQKKE
ncbi:hypothetical protein FQN54_008977 [Arachnomyces sp. PD_36]|nr:hypothetical protein FQN54_008977 [Arachnomyces sp. PD_36]